MEHQLTNITQLPAELCDKIASMQCPEMYTICRLTHALPTINPHKFNQSIVNFFTQSHPEVIEVCKNNFSRFNLSKHTASTIQRNAIIEMTAKNFARLLRQGIITTRWFTKPENQVYADFIVDYQHKLQLCFALAGPVTRAKILMSTHGKNLNNKEILLSVEAMLRIKDSDIDLCNIDKPFGGRFLTKEARRELKQRYSCGKVIKGSNMYKLYTILTDKKLPRKYRA